MALALVTLTAHAQITVTNSVFSVVGDTLHYAFGNQPNAINAVYTPPGGNQVWDLSALQADSTWEAIYRDPATGVGAADFPGAALMLAPADALPDQEDYLNVSATEVSQPGSFGVDPLQLGSSWTVQWTPQGLPISWAPLNFFDIRQASLYTLHYYQPSEMPPGWTTQFPTNDSIRMRTTISVLGVVDAWGTITIPGGSYEVLREKRTMYTETRIDAKIAPLGWLDMTDVCISQYGMGAPLGADTTVTFHFVNDLAKETIALCEINDAQNEVLRVRYKVADFSTAAGSAAAADVPLRVFPNPATDRIEVQAPGFPPGAYDLLVMDAVGRQVVRRRNAPGGQGLQLELDISGLEAGVYRGSIVPATGDRVPFRFVKR